MKILLYTIILLFSLVCVFAANGDTTKFGYLANASNSSTMITTVSLGGFNGTGNFTGKIITIEVVENGTSLIYKYLLITDQRYNDTLGINSLNLTKLNITDQRYNDTLGIDSLNLTKLNITDQRYNDTLGIDSLNSSKANLAGGNNFSGMNIFTDANFTGSVWFNTIIITSINITGSVEAVDFIENGTSLINKYLLITDQRYNDTLGIDSLNLTKLNITDQRYNDTLGIDALNLSKLNVSDQRYNDTLGIGALNSSKANLVGGNNFTGGTNVFTDANFTGVVWINNINSTNITGFSAANEFIENGVSIYLKYASISGLNSLNSTKLNVSDQRYNDTAGIDALNLSKLNITDQRYNETAGIDALNLSKLNITDQIFNDTTAINTVNNTAIKNSTTANLTNLDVVNNITAYGYLFGQPLLGMMGSGLISSTQTNAVSEVNITCAGLTCSYNAFVVRLVTGTSNQFAKYCTIPASSVLATNNAHNVFYIDNNCNIQVTTIDTWFNTLISNGGVWDFGNAVCYKNLCTEVVNGIGLEQRRMMKQRVINFNKNHLSVTQGFIKTTNVFPNWTLSSGKYIYLMDVVDATQKVAGAVNSVEVISPNGTGWINNDQNRMNITTCQNGTTAVLCTNTNRWRRVFFFMIGWNGTTDTSGLHQLLPSQTIFYTSLSLCIDTVTSPLTYTIPDFYTYSAVPLYALCIRPSDTAWTTSDWIDLRTVKVGSVTSTSTANFVPYTGATSDLNLGAFNLTASGVTLTNTFVLNTSGVGNTNAMHTYGNVDNFFQIDISNKNNGSSASSDFVATANNGDDNSYYINLGINSANYSAAAYNITGANDGYLFVQNGSLTIGTATSGKIIIFHVNGTLTNNEVGRFNSSGFYSTNSIHENGVSLNSKYNDTTAINLKANLAGGNNFSGTNVFTDANFTGVVWINNVNSTNVTGFVSANGFIENGVNLSVKYALNTSLVSVNATAVAALPKAGGTMTGNITVTSNMGFYVSSTVYSVYNGTCFETRVGATYEYVC